MIPQILHALSFFSSGVLALFLTPAMRGLARRAGLVDRPDQLKKHGRPTPYLGGLAIYVSFMASVTAVLLLAGMADARFVGLVSGATVVCALGILDDCKRLSVSAKLLGQLAAAGILVLSGLRLEIVYLPLWLNIALTVVWIVGITNAFNIVDIMDGLAASLAAISAATFFFIAVPTGDLFTAIVSTALAGACIGFAGYNWYPATIFMGDAGSLLLGFVLAAVSISTSYTARNDIALLSPLLVLALPIYDTLYVSVLRMARGRNPLRGSPDHFALRLRAVGLKDPYVVLIMCLVSIVLCQASYIATTVNLLGALFIYLVTLIVFVVVGGSLSKVRT
jgi:UDP-GlcNAc:undecaprenyl-phosphate GlcNAc-1-phosphate transferase